jgi:putative heme-binding domain-containing protein
MYFTVGGRNTQSELFRVTYVGDDSTTPLNGHDSQHAELRTLRQKIEEYQDPRYMSERPMTAVQFLMSHLDHVDRHIRYAAMTALTSRQTGIKKETVYGELNIDQRILATIALTRNSDVKTTFDFLLDTFREINFGAISERQQIDYLRALSLVITRKAELSEDVHQKLLNKLDPYYPTKSENVNRELVQMLVYLDSPTIVGKAMNIMREPSINEPPDLGDLLTRNKGYGGTIRQVNENHPDLRQYHLAFVLRNATKGWSSQDLVDYFDWFNRARTWSGGASYQGFLENISNEAYANINEQQRLAVEAAGVRKPFTLPELPKPKGPGRQWSLGDLVSLEQKLKGRNFEHGQKMFAATRCVICHRFAGEGGATGPDLTQLARRFNLKDLSEAIVEPSKVISDQYLGSSVVTTDGDVYNGRIINETKTSITILTDPEDSTKVVEVPRQKIEEMVPSKVSIMPADLLKPLNEEEVLDLLAYLLSRGDKGHPMFKK